MPAKYTYTVERIDVDGDKVPDGDLVTTWNTTCAAAAITAGSGPGQDGVWAVHQGHGILFCCIYTHTLTHVKTGTAGRCVAPKPKRWYTDNTLYYKTPINDTPNECYRYC